VADGELVHNANKGHFMQSENFTEIATETGERKENLTSFKALEPKRALCFTIINVAPPIF
jgi:hypothetical protein